MIALHPWLPQVAAVQPDREDPHRSGLIRPDEDEAFAVRGVVTRNIVAAWVGRNPGKTATI